MKKILLTAALAAVGMASAQQDPCAGRGGAPLPSYCYQNQNSGAAPVYHTPTYQPRYQQPMDQAPRYAPPPRWNDPRWDDRRWNQGPQYVAPYTPQPYTYNDWDDWDGDHVDIYVDNVLVMPNVYRSDIGRLNIRRPGRHLIRVVPVGYTYDRPIYTRYYDAPSSGASLTFSFGGNFNIILR